MTSIAETRVRSRGTTLLRGLLLTVVLAGGALLTPAPWASLWFAVPATVAAAFLLAWRFGVPALLLGPLLYAGLAFTAGPAASWAWWIPAGALTGAWMGLNEEREDAVRGRAWMLMPLLVLAAMLPWLPGYTQRVQWLEGELKAGDTQMLEAAREVGLTPERIASLRRSVEENAPVRRVVLPNALPTMLFVWVALLAVAGRTLGARLAEGFRWPAPSRLRLTQWRLPDGAIWTFLGGMALLVAQWPAWAPTAWTLLVNSGLGFCIQGIAVVESLMLARGIPPTVIALTLAFVCVLALPVFMFTTAVLGLSDFWLDYRRIEASPDGETE